MTDEIEVIRSGAQVLKLDYSKPGLAKLKKSTPLLKNLALFGMVKHGDIKLELFKRIVFELWPEPLFVWDRWADLVFGALCGAKETVERVASVTINANYPWWRTCLFSGAAATGKSSRAAMWVLVNWMIKRNETSCVLTSTSLEMLKKRIWAELVHWAELVIQGQKDNLIDIVRSETLIRWHPNDEKGAIFGRAVDQGGSVDNAVGRIKGIHNRRVFAVTDEMTAMPEAFSKACRNLNKGTREFQLIGLGNATDQNDQHGIHSEPMDGWNEAGFDSEFWLTKVGGCCIILDGHKSPALEDPERFHFYIKKEDLESEARFYGGTETSDYYRECRGRWAPSGSSSNIMDEALFSQFHASDKAIWESGWEMCTGFDPAWEGGDRAILYPFKRGKFSTGEMGIEFQQPIIVKVDITQDKRFLHYGLADAVMGHCERLNVKPENYAADVTGEGGAFHAILSARWSPLIKGVEFGGSAEKTQISSNSPQTWFERYGNKVTMLWFLFRAYVEGNQIRGLNDPMTRQELTSRKRLNKGGKTVAEPKKDMKLSGRRSCDLGDAAVVSTFLMYKLGHMPLGLTASTSNTQTAKAWNTMVSRFSLRGVQQYTECA